MKVPNYHNALQTVLSAFLKRQVNVDFKLMEPGGTVDVPADHTLEKAASPRAPGSPKTRQEWQKDPVVRSTLEFFNGSIVDVRE